MNAYTSKQGKYLKYFGMLFVLLISSVTLYASDSFTDDISQRPIASIDACPALIDLTLNTVADTCSGTDRNQVCYGNLRMQAEFQADAPQSRFENVGDITDASALRRLQLNPYNPDTGEWGVALMRLQASLPDSNPGQNVTFLVFGDTLIENAAGSDADQRYPTTQVTTISNVNVRVQPTTSSRVIQSVRPGTELVANGMDSSREWLQIEGEDGARGWVSKWLVADFDSEILRVIDPNVPLNRPMQSFYLTPGAGRQACRETPTDGILLQTPHGVQEVTMRINDVDFKFGSTILFTLNPETNEMTATALEGTVKATSHDVTRTAIAGTQIKIQFDENRVAMASASHPAPYGDSDYSQMPVSMLERQIEVALPLEGNYSDRLTEYNDIFDGMTYDQIMAFLEYLETDGSDPYGFLVNELDYMDFSYQATRFLESRGVDFGNRAGGQFTSATPTETPFAFSDEPQQSSSESTQQQESQESVVIYGDTLPNANGQAGSLFGQQPTTTTQQPTTTTQQPTVTPTPQPVVTIECPEKYYKNEKYREKYAHLCEGPGTENPHLGGGGDDD